jgi:hypothetical protein
LSLQSRTVREQHGAAQNRGKTPQEMRSMPLPIAMAKLVAVIVAEAEAATTPLPWSSM